MLIDHDGRWAFVHIPKTAGKAVTTALGRKHTPNDHSMKEASEATDYFRFCAVRNPVDRFISAYRYSVYMTDQGILSGHPVRAFIRDHGLYESVPQFIDAVREHNFDVTGSLHFRPQIWWITRGRPHYVARQETLAADLRRLELLLGMSIVANLARTNVSEVQVDTTLTEGQRSWLGSLYDYDFAALGYTRPS